MFRRATTRVLLLLCAMYFITYIDRVNVSTAASQFGAELGLNHTQVGFVFSAFAYPYLIFQIIGGWVGDRFGPRDRAQDLGTTLGKVVRINADGTIPSDNPFVRRDGARPEIWSYGHRNVQAAALDAEGRLWTVEHGARGGDELNAPQAGKNYGWPVITYGMDYSGAKIGVGTARAGMEQPVYYWDPVIAPSGAAFYTGDRFPEWKGDLLVGSLQPGRLVRLRLADGRVTQEERYVIEPGERVRDVRQGPDGFIYLLTDNPRGRIVRLEPAS